VTEEKAAKLTGVLLRKASSRESHLTIELREGRNREVRRLFESAGHEVTRLKRVRFGGLELGDLQPGEWRDLSRAEIAAAFDGAPTIEGGPKRPALRTIRRHRT
jgi:pseudouridine synthase